MKNDIQERLKRNYLTQEWLRHQLIAEYYHINKSYLSQILCDTNCSDSAFVQTILYEATRILNRYEETFRKDIIQVGDLVSGLSELNEYVSGTVLSLEPFTIASMSGKGKVIICTNPRRL